MSYISTPVKGMNDMLPADMRLREHVLSMIKSTYASYGFSQIETPAMEHIENLSGKDGGENEKLIFKVLKRGAELERALQSGSELADSGLRYDLTVPLARFYANNAAKLPTPFKALQIGNVWRADRPQKGRFRQFTQCDIDILGDESVLAEIELITATCAMLKKIFSEISVSGFTVHVNDRRILKGMAASAGFAPEAYDEVFITLDKLDKIGLDGVRAALLEEGHAPEVVERYTAQLSSISPDISAASFCVALSPEHLPPEVPQQLDDILRAAAAITGAGVHLIFDPTLVRGMSYYTGTIFEVTVDGYSFSVAGGGRYDDMIGKFSGQKVPACGFSIGFERIITVLSDHLKAGYSDGTERVALLVDRRFPSGRLTEVFRQAAELRAAGKTVTVQPLKKNAKFQIDRLCEEGYTDIRRIYAD